MMTALPERWMQLASIASVEQESTRLNDLTNDLTTEPISILEEKGDRLTFPRDHDE
jgi:hypothetical protein